MRKFFSRNSRFTIPNCGTAACIAGWAVTLVKKTNPANCYKGDTWDAAAEALGLDGRWHSGNLPSTNSGKLFWMDEWPKQYKKDCKEGSVAFARNAVRRIDHFIKTNGQE